MTTSTINKPGAKASLSASIAANAISGRGAQARMVAFTAIATCAYAYEGSKQAAIANLRKALGAEPSEALVAVSKQENTIGFALARMPASEFPRGCAKLEERMIWVREQVTLYVAPAKAPEKGKKANKLRAGKLGYRSALVDRIIRNAEQATSKLFAELALSGAKTEAQSQKDKAKRAKGGNPAPHHGKAGKEAAPSHSVLVQPAKPVTQAEFIQHMVTQLSSLIAYDSKHAKLRPTECSKLADDLRALKQTANAAANAFALRGAVVALKAVPDSAKVA